MIEAGFVRVTVEGEGQEVSNKREYDGTWMEVLEVCLSALHGMGYHLEDKYQDCITDPIRTSEYIQKLESLVKRCQFAMNDLAEYTQEDLEKVQPLIKEIENLGL